MKEPAVQRKLFLCMVIELSIHQYLSCGPSVGAQVLLIKRATPPNVGWWSFPGGGLELGSPAASDRAVHLFACADACYSNGVLSITKHALA